MDVEMGIIKNEDILVKILLKSRCYEFWFIKHPLYFLWVWLLSVLIMSIIISEYYKNN
jgi:hypothetical protein